MKVRLSSSSGAAHFLASNNDCAVRDYDMEKFELSSKWNASWPVNVSLFLPVHVYMFSKCFLYLFLDIVYSLDSLHTCSILLSAPTAGLS